MGSHEYGHMNAPHATWCGHRPSTTFHSNHRLKPLASLDYHVHSVLAADIHSLALRTIFSQAVCSKARKFLWWVGLLLEDQKSESSTKDYEGKPRLWFLLQVHWNRPKGMFYVSCSNVTARNIWNWKYSKVTTAEAFLYHHAATANLRDSRSPALKPWRLWSWTSIISAMSSQIVISSSNPFLWHCTIDP